MEQTGAWGFHLMLDCSNCKNEAITNPETLKAWVQELVQEIQMVAYGEPQIVHFGENDPKLTGWTVLQLIETSNIMAHFNDFTNEAYIDVFSCREFDRELAIGVVRKYFSPESYSIRYLERKAP